MKENNEWKIGAMILVIAFLLVIALIGWAKFADEKKVAELWYARYSDEVDELREVRDSRDYLDITLTKVIHDRDFYKNALDNVSPYCSEGMYELTIDGLRERVEFLEAQVDSCTSAYLQKRDNLKTCKALLDEAFIGRPEGWNRNFEDCLRWTGNGFYMDGDIGFCSGASWFWDTDTAQPTYDNYLYCKSKPNCTTWND